MPARLLRLFLFVALLAGGSLSPVLAQDGAPPSVSNASPRDLENIYACLKTLASATRKGDPNALAYYGASPTADNSPIRLLSRVTQVAVSATGALVRQTFELSILRDTPVPLSSGVQDFWLTRNADGTFALSANRFETPPEALSQLQQLVEEENTDDGPEVLDVVASRVGGRWIALRRQQWGGDLETAKINANMLPRDFMLRQVTHAPTTGAITAHFLFRNDGTLNSKWEGLGAAFNPIKRADAQADRYATSWRDRMARQDYTFASSHREFALALFRVGLLNEGADELKKASLLDPNTVTTKELEQADKNRALDPQTALARQLQDEKNIGVGSDHPTIQINALQLQQRNQPNALSALRIALEYSRLAQDARAQSWVNQAVDLQNRGAFRPDDRDWLKLLFDHLRERTTLSKVKPSTILRSQLFTVRIWPDDPQVVTLLASLEEAQHTVYADFGIPMGNTEVLLWHNQKEFARYTTQFAEQGGNEFVAALTLTKLVTTRRGPLVLGEEVNTFSDTSDTQPLFGTLAHEYGHVAVRQLSQGRSVPVWFNEGIATSCEGGYEKYISRVRNAANAGTLLSMSELLDWNVDGERAFLAYSQANSILDYIVAKWGKNAVLDILRKIGQAVPPEDAFQGVLGIGQSELWNRWAREGIR